MKKIYEGKMNKFKRLFIVLIGLSLSVSFLYSQSNEELIKKIENHIKYLASDELEGRFPGTPGIEKAADYIANYFKSIGIQPINGSYFQTLKVVTGTKLGTNNKFEVNVLVPKPGIPKDMWKPSTKKWDAQQMWIPISFSENGSATGDLAFVGYGISSDKLQYDDYKDIDVNNKIVIILTGSPDGENEEKSKFNNYLSLRYKAKNARDHGAAAVIFVKSQGDSADVLMQLKWEQMNKNSGVIAIQANRTALSKLFPNESQLNPVEKEINKTKKPKSFIIPNTSIALTIDLVDDQKETKNIVGILKGKNPKLSEEYIVLGAHYDHLGWGQVGSIYRGKTPMVHNGADDNASGVAGVMELAAKFASNPPERSMAFILFTGEELGLLGSSHYVDSPLIPMEKVVMMMNFDMIGRMKDNQVQIFGFGSSPDFTAPVDSLALIDSVKIVKLADGFGPSDHSSFYKKNIPVMHIFTGVHADYHSPKDDWDLINYPGEAKIIDLFEKIARHFANKEEKPKFEKVKEEAKDQQSTRGGNGAWFGIVPNFEDNPKGCKISGTSPGSPAQKAGLLENDIITTINGKQVKNLHDFMYTVNEYKPGDVLDVKLIRNDKEIDVKVTLAKRKKD